MKVEDRTKTRINIHDVNVGYLKKVIAKVNGNKMKLYQLLSTAFVENQSCLRCG